MSDIRGFYNDLGERERKEIVSLDDEGLQDFLVGPTLAPHVRNFAENERNRRILAATKTFAERAAKPHWTRTWGFAVSCVSAVAGIAATVLAYLAWQRPKPPSAQDSQIPIPASVIQPAAAQGEKR